MKSGDGLVSFVRHGSPIDVGEIIKDFVIDLFLIDHRKVFKKCLQELVFTNMGRLKEVREEIEEAAASGDHKTIDKYMAFGHRLYVDPFDTYYSPLDMAIMNGHYECVRVLLNYAESYLHIETCGDGPVVVAIHSRQTEILRLLLMEGFNPWGTDYTPAIPLLEWGFMEDAIEVYIDCGVKFSASYLVKSECVNILKYLMNRGFDPTDELFQGGNTYDWWGDRRRLFKLIYVSCHDADPYNWSFLSRFMDHEEVSDGGDLLEFHEENKELGVLLDVLRSSGFPRFDFLWLQE